MLPRNIDDGSNTKTDNQTSDSSVSDSGSGSRDVEDIAVFYE